MKHYHPQRDELGQLVEITKPSQPSSLEAWHDPETIATVTPGSPMPGTVDEIAIASWTDIPTELAGWESLVTDCCFDEPPFKTHGKRSASGAVVLEADGRIWVVSPSNQFGGYTHTFPKGTLSAKEGMSLRANALKEVYEEAGLRIALTGFLCDCQRSLSTTRYYLARRLGGNPADMGWESQAVHLVPKAKLAVYLTNKYDAPLLEALA